MRKAVFILLALCGTYMHTCAQTTDAAQQVKTYLDAIEYWRYAYSPEDSGVNPNANPQDSLLAANNKLEQFLLHGGGTSIAANDNMLDNAGMRIISSDDKNLRIYSWNTETGEGRDKYHTIIEYKTSAGYKAVAATDEHEYTQILTAGKNFYLCVYGHILSDKDAMKGIRVLSISNNKPEPQNIIRTATELTDHIEYTYDYSANFSFKTMKETNVIHLEKQSLYIPEVSGGNMTGKWLVYVFDGKEFVYDKNAK